MYMCVHQLWISIWPLFLLFVDRILQLCRRRCGIVVFHFILPILYTMKICITTLYKVKELLLCCCRYFNTPIDVEQQIWIEFGCCEV